MSLPSSLPGTRSDGGGVLVAWVIKLVVILGLCAVAGYDAISITSTTAAVDDNSSYAATAAARVWRDTKDVQRSYETALTAAAEKNPKDRLDPKKFRIEPDGTVYLTVERKAKTVVLYRIGPLAHFAEVSREATGRPGS